MDQHSDYQNKTIFISFLLPKPSTNLLENVDVGTTEHIASLPLELILSEQV